MNSVVINPYEYFADPTQGRPIFNGFVYIGQPDTDPEVPANQKQVYARQEDGNEVAIAQPVRTNAGGYPTYNGSVVAIVVDGPHSLKVNNKDGSQLLYSSNNYNGIATTDNYGSVILATDQQALAGTPDVIPDAEQVRKNHIAQVATIAALRALEPAFDGQQVELLGHTVKGIGGGVFYHDAASVAADDNGVTIVTPGGKRWVRKLDGYVTPEMFGATESAPDSLAYVSAAISTGFPVVSNLALLISEPPEVGDSLISGSGSFSDGTYVVPVSVYSAQVEITQPYRFCYGWDNRTGIGSELTDTDWEDFSHNFNLLYDTTVRFDAAGIYNLYVMHKAAQHGCGVVPIAPFAASTGAITCTQPQFDKYISQIGKIPALFGWYCEAFYDDPTAHMANYYSVMKSATPTKQVIAEFSSYTQATWDISGAYGFSQDNCDILVTYAYPFLYGDSSPGPDMATRVNSITKIIKSYSLPIIPLYHLFGSTVSTTWRTPTLDEVKSEPVWWRAAGYKNVGVYKWRDAGQTFFGLIPDNAGDTSFWDVAKKYLGPLGDTVNPLNLGAGAAYLEHIVPNAMVMGYSRNVGGYVSISSSAVTVSIEIPVRSTYGESIVGGNVSSYTIVDFGVMTRYGTITGARVYQRRVNDIGLDLINTCTISTVAGSNGARRFTLTPTAAINGESRKLVVLQIDITPDGGSTSIIERINIKQAI